MATNKPGAEAHAIRKGNGRSTWTKRDISTGKFMDQKKAPAKIRPAGKAD
jgi:hypothetical protein